MTCDKLANMIKLSLLCCVFSAGCQYGPSKDQSAFVSAMLMNDDNVIFSYQNTVYKQAQGMAAFPDGGTQKYIRDRNIIGQHNIKTGKTKILLSENNRKWAHNQGHFQITHVKYPYAIAAQGGQDRELIGSLYVDWLANIETGKVTPIDTAGNLRNKGYKVVERHLADKEGTIVLIVNPLESKSDDYKDGISELWIRTSTGEYRKIAATWHYQTAEAGEIIYWMLDTRQFMAYNLASGQTRNLPDYRVPPFSDIDKGVTLSSNRSTLKYGNKVNDKWEYTPLDIPVAGL